MSRASVLARGRAAAEAGLLDTCTIVRVTSTTTNPTTGVVTETTDEVYEGPCRVQEPGGYARDISTAPDQPQLAPHRVLQLPVATSEGVRVGDRVTIDSCVNDPDLVGVRMTVRDQAAKSEATARRIGIEQITG